MAQFDQNKQQFNRNNNTLYEVNIQGDRYGQLYGLAASATSAFGEPVAVQINPVIQLDGLYGLDDRQFETFNASTGSATTTGTLMQVATGTGAGGYGVVRSRRAVRYRPGQGMLGRFTAKFTHPSSANYTQRAGFFTQEQALQVGFDGTQFGVLRQNGGKAHIEEIQIQAAKGSGTENITIELNGVNTSVSPIVSTATTISTLTKEIYDAMVATPAYAAWILEWTVGSDGFGYIRALSRSVGPLAGAFSATTDGASTISTSTVQTGVAHTTQWTYQSNFTLDKLDGTGPSGMVLDPTKLNVFQINLRWLGAGRIQYAIEDPFGCMVPFHTEFYANENTNVHLDNPTMKLGYVAADLTGAGGTGVTVEGASMMGAIEGNINITSFPATHNNRLSSTTNGVINHIFTIKNKLVHQGKINLREVILEKLSAGVDATSFTFGNVYLFLNATISADHVWEDIGENSFVQYSDVAGTITLANEQPLASFTLIDEDVSVIDLESLRIALPPNNTISLGIIPETGTPKADATLVWIED